MPDFTRELLINGTSAARAGDKQEARFYLERLLDLDAPLQVKMEAWYWLSQVSDDPKEKRNYLEEILANNLGDARARRALAILNGEIKQDEIVDPDRIKQKAAAVPQEADARRFICPKCGGRMTFSPDGQTLVCEFCQQREMLAGGGLKQAGNSQNFSAALATAKGHFKPMTVRTFTCKGCGVSFTLPPQHMTMVCPYCESVYVVEQVEPRELIEPHGIIPFQVNDRQAKSALLQWFKGREFERLPHVAPGKGLYLPAWLFDVGGVISWTYQVVKERRSWVALAGSEAEMSTFSESAAICENNILILAAASLPQGLKPAISSFDLAALVPFDERFLADWMAQAYQVALADASLDARERVFKQEKGKIQNLVPMNSQNLVVNSANMVVSAYQLIMLPVWLTYFEQDGRREDILINGQTSKVFSAVCKADSKNGGKNV
jgi:hypothetical protein